MKEGNNLTALKDTFRIMVNRPFVSIIFGLAALGYYLLDYFFNPVSSLLLLGFGTVEGSGIFESIITIIQTVFSIISNPKVLLISMLVFTILIVIASAILSLIFSGLFNVINNTLDGKPRFKGEFRFGIKKYYNKLFVITLKVLFMSSALVLFIMLASVPAVVISRAAVAGKTELGIVALLLNLVTIIVIFFGLMFYRIYVSFWFPASVKFEKDAFSIGRKIADKNFWGMVGSFIVFDIVFIVFQGTIIYAYYLNLQSETKGMFDTIAIFAGNCLFKTIFFSTFITYIFSKFKTYSEDVE